MTNDEKIDEIMDYFDFARVAKAMEALDWKWCLIGCETDIPDEPILRREARRLLRLVVGSKSLKGEAYPYYKEAIGGLEAIQWKDGTLELRFVLESWSAWK